MPMNNEGKYGHLIMQECILPERLAKPEVVEQYEKFGKRIHWVDNHNIPGAFQMNTSWYKKPNREFSVPGKGVMAPHAHDCAEILGFYGSDPENPEELNGEIEFHIDGEKHIFTKSTMVFLPAGLPHCPLVINRADRPIFHYSVLMAETYSYLDPETGEPIAKD